MKKGTRATKLVSLALAASVLATMGTGLGASAAVPSEDGQYIVPEQSTFFAYADIEERGTQHVKGSDGDLWPAAWADDGYLYTANGDGKGFGDTWQDLWVNRIDGVPGEDGNGVASMSGINLTNRASQVWSGPSYNRKPTGMVAVGNTLYLAVQDLNCSGGNNNFNDAPAATICKSTDMGKTWEWDTSGPMFEDLFTTIMFLDYGQGGREVPPEYDGYVYAYGLDYNWRTSYNDAVPDPTELFLARVPKDSIMDRSTWEFYAGDLEGNASWTKDISQKKPVMRDDSVVYARGTTGLADDFKFQDCTIPSQGSIVYNKALNRYLYSAWTEYTFEFYESPTPYGPWKKFLSKDYGGYNWMPEKNGGYATTIPSKFISDDGLTMWVQSNTFEGGASNYQYSLRKLVVVPYDQTAATTPTNTVYSDDNFVLNKPIPEVTPFATTFQWGRKGVLNNGLKNDTEQSWNNVFKDKDYWGYYFEQAKNMNKVVFTTGQTFADGGSFQDDLKVQVRQNFQWVDVTNMVVTPEIVNQTNQFTSYTFTFDDTWGDGVRVIGTPAFYPNASHMNFTSARELEIFYSGVSQQERLGTLLTNAKAALQRANGKTFDDSVPGAEGIDGQYPLSAYNDLSDGINTAQTVYDNGGAGEAAWKAQVETLNALYTAFNASKVKVDRSELKSLLDKANSFNKFGYTDEDWNKLQADKAIAQTAYEKNDAKQSDIDAAVEAFAPIVTKFETINAISALKALVANNENRVQGNFTDESWAEFKTALTAAQDLLKKSDITKEQADAAAKALERAVYFLKRDTPFEKLSNLVKEANLRTKEIYTVASWSQFEAKLTSAKDILSVTNRGDEFYEQAYNELSAAMNQLELKEDLDGLKAMIDVAAYTAEREKDNLHRDGPFYDGMFDGGKYDALKAAIDAASALVGGIQGEPTLEQLNAIPTQMQSLYNAYMAFAQSKLTVDRSDLKKVIDDAENRDEAFYTEESWQAMQSVLASAKDLYEKPQVTQQEIKDSANQLYDALNALVEKDSNPGGNGGNSGNNQSETPSDSSSQGSSDGNQGKPQTGDAAGTILLVCSLLMAGAAALAVALIRRQKVN